MNENERQEFKNYLFELKPDGFILAGDIAEADSVIGFLKDFRKSLSCPIYFVLGNHDFWGGTFDETKNVIRALVKDHSNLYWFTECSVIPLDLTNRAYLHHTNRLMA